MSGIKGMKKQPQGIREKIVSEHNNGYSKNEFSILKTECIYQVKLQTYEEAILPIEQHICFCNNERIQAKKQN